MSRSITLLALLALLSAVAVACSSDKVTAPKDPLATRLTEVADSSAEADYRIASALYAASAMVQAGGKVSTVQMVVDSEPRTFSAVAFRVSYSKAACDQLKNMLMMLEADSSGGSGGFDGYDPCRPMQTLIAWEGESMTRVAVVQGDTGTTTMNSESPYSWNFWGELYDREARTEWWLRTGTQSSGLVGDGEACRAKSIPEQGIDFTCRLVTLRHSFELVLEEFPVIDFGDDSLARKPRGADIRGDTIFGDTVYVDSTWVWEPGPQHTLSMPTHVVNGLSMEITKLDFEDGLGREVKASARRGGRFKRSRTR